MKAAWYETQGPAGDVLVVGEMPDPIPEAGEVRIRVQASGINPGDVKKRGDAFGVGMPFPRIIPHNDGSGIIDMVGDGVSPARVGDRVWCFGAQSYRPFGTAANYVLVPESNTGTLPDRVDFAQGACLGIPGVTGHRAVHVAGRPAGRTVLVQGGAGAVGSAAVALAHFAGARVIATVRSSEQEVVVQAAGADAVIRTDEIPPTEVVSRILDVEPEGVEHIVEVAFHANVLVDEQVLRQGGSIATYATGDPNPTIPFWPLVFENVRIYFLGSDDFTFSDRSQAVADLSAALETGWTGYSIAARFPLEEVAQAHRTVEQGNVGGRVVVDLTLPAGPSNRR